MSNDSIALIVGLGNPGPDYAKTRHNAGAWLVDAIAQATNTSLSVNKKLFCYLGKACIAGQNVFLCIPTTYMNHSGQAINAVTQYYKIAASQLLVAHDELDLSPGTLRLKKDGGHGGHNGLRDIISHLHSRNFLRARIGIGHPGNSKQVSNFVLKPPTHEEETKILESIYKLVHHMPAIIEGNVQSVMKSLHTEEQ